MNDLAKIHIACGYKDIIKKDGQDDVNEGVNFTPFDKVMSINSLPEIAKSAILNCKLTDIDEPNPFGGGLFAVSENALSKSEADEISIAIIRSIYPIFSFKHDKAGHLVAYVHRENHIAIPKDEN